MPHPRSRSVRCVCAALMVPVVLVAFSVLATGRGLTSSAHAADPPAIEARQGMVVAAEPLAAEVGLDILRKGGNAVDAAVAVGFALAVTYPVAGNLGGGGFLVAHLEGRGPVALDFREVAPAAAHKDLYREADLRGRDRASLLGHLAVAVPGSVAGLLQALDRWGSLPRAAVLEPAIRLAEEGFPVQRPLAGLLASPELAADLQRFRATAALFYPQGRALTEGQLLRQPDLARTLRLIAEQGAAGFYQGPVAAALVREMQQGGGIITARDLEAYRPVERTPLRTRFRDLTIVGMPPPSSGGLALAQMLAILERYPLATLGHNSSAALHLIAEVLRRAFADRNQHLGDPDAQEIPLARLLSAAHLDRLASGIDAQLATPSLHVVRQAAAHEEREQTTHFAVVDRARNAVAVTTTLNGAFGSKVIAEGTGVFLNNEMDDFTTRPGQPNLYGLVQGEANLVRPGRRPLSSMAPTVVLDARGQVRHVLGTPGGPTIISNVLQVLLNLEVHGLAPQAAVNAPKIHHQCLPDRLDLEPGIPADVHEGLLRRGHALRVRAEMGDFQLISVDPQGGLLRAAADPRGGGAARGY